MKKLKIGKRIKEMRLRRQLKQNEFSKIVGIAANKLSEYERDITVPSVPNLAKITKVLDVTVDYLMFGKLDENAEKEITDKELLSNFKKVSVLPTKDKKMILEVVRSLLLASKVQSVTG